MQIKNTIPAEFIFNSALLKNIEHMVRMENEAVSNERLIVEVQRRLNVEKMKYSLTYTPRRCICYARKIITKRDLLKYSLINTSASEDK